MVIKKSYFKIAFFVIILVLRAVKLQIKTVLHVHLVLEENTQPFRLTEESVHVH